MRPLRLSLTGFGPFFETQTVDLRGFRYSKLFLIHGPVGSGKTFLLDGICFALYGRSSGGERDRKGLRHVGAGRETDTIVVLDFEVSGENYRVERRLMLGPEPVGGFLPDDVVLWRLPSFGEPTRRDILSSSLTGVESLVVRLLGLNADQFCQVAILPQGQFRRFLLAPAAERTAIISRMFEGDRYRRFQALLEHEHTNLKERLAQAWQEREDLTRRYQDRQGDPRESLRQSREDLEAVSQSCLAHQHKSTEWERSLESAVRYETLERQREMSLRELQDLTNQGEAPADALYGRLKKALPTFLRWREATQDMGEISRELDGQRAQYEKLKRETNFLEAEVEDARRREEEKYALRRTLERLGEVRRESEGLRMLESEVEAASRRLEELGRSRAALASEVKRAKLRGETLSVELARLEKAERWLDDLRREVADLEKHDQVNRQKIHLTETVEQSRQRESRLSDAIVLLRRDLETARDRRDQVQAQSRLDALTLLRRELVEGRECPLCGGEEHPRPFESRSQQEAIPEELESRIEELRERCRRAEQELSQAEERRARLEGRLDGMPDQEADQEDIAGLLVGLRGSIMVIESKLAQRQSLHDERERCEQELLPGRKKLRQMRLRKERLQTTMETAVGLRKSHRERLDDLLREALPAAASPPDAPWVERLEQEQARIATRLEQLELATYSTERAELMAETFALGLAETRAAEKRRERLAQEASELQDSLLERFRLDFASWPDLMFALNRAAREYQVQSGEGSVIDKEMLIKAVQRQLDQSQELLGSVPQPELSSEKIRSALAREREQVEFKVGRRASLQRSVEEELRDVEIYDVLVETIRGLETQLRALSPLADAVTGNNPVSLSFADWVLERCFSRVLACANLKLELLAPQRFALLLEPGLEVHIFDYQAGISRSATTLSGGESFLASLALALGLGEVLQGEETAADRLGTLFIDEGFGYLDEEALAAALACLENLRTEGRTIGVVSHVAELRERIRAQIVVSLHDEERGGSRVQVYGA